MSSQISPLCIYMGNKMDIADWIVPMFPRHKTYVEVFGGTAAILLNKTRSPIEVYNDKNIYLSNLFESIIRHHDEFAERVMSWNISEVRFNDYFENHDVSPTTYPDLEAALRYYYILKVVGFGRYNGGFYVNIDSPNGYKLFQKSIGEIKDFYNRFKSVIVFNRDFERLIKNFNKPDVLLYLDPPYKGTESYYETLIGSFKDEDHIRLRDRLITFKGMYYLSYEDDEFIRELYSYSGLHILEMNKFRPGLGHDKKEIIITNKFPDHNFLFSNKEMLGI